MPRRRRGFGTVLLRRGSLNLPVGGVGELARLVAGSLPSTLRQELERLHVRRTDDPEVASVEGRERRGA